MEPRSSLSPLNLVGRKQQKLMFSKAVANMWNVKATLVNIDPCEQADKCTPIFNANLSSGTIFPGMLQKSHRRNRKKISSAGQILFPSEVEIARL